MSKVFVFDFNICNGCHNCQVACKDEFCEQPWLPYSEAQPMTGQFWMKLDERVRGQVPFVKISYRPTMCNHCENCVALTDEGAAYRREDGLVILDPAKTKGRRDLVEACPVGAIYYNDELDIPQKCTGCAHLLDNGWDVPRCVDACPTEALRYVDESEVDLSKAGQLSAVEGMGSKVYFLNMPKRFIAGTVANVSEAEVEIGTPVELVDESGVVVSTQVTDDFGDFKFDQIEKGRYTVKAVGEVREADVTEKDLYIGVFDTSN